MANAILKPPHISAPDKRRYKHTLALPKHHPEKRLLLAFYKLWASWSLVTSVYSIPETELGFTVPKRLRKRLFSNPDVHCEFEFRSIYFLVFQVIALFDAWNGHSNEVAALEKHWRKESDFLLDLALSGIQGARKQQLDEVAALCAEIANVLFLLRLRLNT